MHRIILCIAGGLALLAGCALPVPGSPLSTAGAPAAPVQASPRPGASSAATPVPNLPGEAASALATSTTVPAAAPLLPGQGSPLGKLAFVQGGAIWAMDLPAGRPQRATGGPADQGPRWSASGDWLAYQRGQDELWAVSAVTGLAHQLQGCQSTPRSWAWSPVSDRLACITTAGGLATMNADGTGRTTPGTPASDQLGSGGGRLAWSPDGKWLAFAPVEKIGSGQPSRLAASLWRIAADGSGAIELANAGKPSDHGFIVAGWSPDGSRVLYWTDPVFSASILADGVPLFSVPANGGPPAQLGPSGAPWAVPSDGGMLVHPDWLAVGPPASGGSGQVAVIFGTGRETWTDKRLGLVNPVSGQVTWLTATGMAASSPNWSPDGNFAAYAAMADAGNLGGGDPARQALMGRRIYIVNTVGTAQPRQLTRDAGYRDEHPAWSADGQQILFARLEATGGASLWLVPVVGGQPRLVLGGLDPALAGGWLGYYGHVNWESMYDWWSGDKGRTAP